MWKDPIVEEVRKNAEELAKEVEGDKRRFIQRLRENQRKSGHKIVSLTGKQRSKTR